MSKRDYLHRSVMDKLLHGEIKLPRKPRKPRKRQIGVREKKIAELYQILKQHFLLSEDEINDMTRSTGIDPFLLNLVLKKRSVPKRPMDFYVKLKNEIDSRKRFNQKPWFRRFFRKKPTGNLIDFQQYFEDNFLHVRKISVEQCYDAYLHVLEKNIARLKQKPFYRRFNVVNLNNIRSMLIFHRDSRQDLKNPKARLASDRRRDFKLTKKNFIKKMVRQTGFFHPRTPHRAHVRKCRETEGLLYSADVNMGGLIDDVYEGDFLPDPLQRANSVIQFGQLRGRIYDGLFASLDVDSFPEFLAKRVKLLDKFISLFDEADMMRDNNEILEKWLVFFNDIHAKIIVKEKIKTLLIRIKQGERVHLIAELRDYLKNLTYNDIMADEQVEVFFDGNDGWMGVSIEELSKQKQKLNPLTPKGAVVNYALLNVGDYARDKVGNNFVNAVSCFCRVTMRGHEDNYFSRFNQQAHRDPEYRAHYLLSTVDVLRAIGLNLATGLQTFMTVGKDCKKDYKMSTAVFFGNSLRMLQQQHKLLVGSSKEYCEIAGVFIRALAISMQAYRKEFEALKEKFEVQVRNIEGVNIDQALVAFVRAIRQAERDIYLGKEDDFRLGINGVDQIDPINKKYMDDLIHGFLQQNRCFVALIYGSSNFSKPEDIFEKSSEVLSRYQNNLDRVNKIFVGAKETVQTAKFVAGQVTEGFNLR